jgi:hypothetical protein
VATEKKLRASPEQIARWEQAASGFKSFNAWAVAALDAVVDAYEARAAPASSERQPEVASSEAAKQEDLAPTPSAFDTETGAPDTATMPADECPRKRFHRRNVWCKTCGQVG